MLGAYAAGLHELDDWLRSLRGTTVPFEPPPARLTATPAARAGMPAAAFEAVRTRQALPRALLPADVAATVAFLASDGAAALTGQTLCTDGGLVMR